MQDGDKTYFVYILASRRNGTLYTGITSELIYRTWQHKNDVLEGFTKSMASIFSSGTKDSPIRRKPSRVKSRSRVGIVPGR
jgi:hypothetical protein